jgi:zinc and cadmium transporter
VSPVAVLPTLAAIALVSSIPLVVAVVLPREPASLQRIVRLLVAFAAGALLGAAFLHILPESFAQAASPGLAGGLALVGFLAFFVLERHLWRHRHGDVHTNENELPPLAALNVLGDAVHNVIDGMAIGAAFLTSPSLGVATSVAVALHEVPQEIGDYGVLLHAGLSRRRAIGWNLVSALAAFVGGVLVLLVGSYVAHLSATLLPIAGGGFIYIAASDLVPELMTGSGKERSVALLLAMLLGIAVTFVPLLLAIG